MPTYSFKVHLPANRSGTAPECNRWTFHHILPWRYFYCLSALLTYYYHGTLNSFVKDNFKSLNLEAEDLEKLIDIANKFSDVVECSTKIEHSRGSSMLSLAEMGRLIDGLSRNNNGIVNEIAGIQLKTRLVECTSPIFGGFAGMDGAQRSDDPGPNMEQKRPANGDTAWWTAITDIGKLLERASMFELIKDREGCKDIKSAVNGDWVKFKLTNEDLDNIILASLRTVVKPRFNTTVLAFDEKSWFLDCLGSQWSIKVAENDFEYPAYSQIVPAFSFSVSETDTHLNRSKHLEMTRCPGVDNAKNILKPTTSAAKIMNGRT
jgi:hypothetical protein